MWRRYINDDDDDNNNNNIRVLYRSCWFFIFITTNRRCVYAHVLIRVGPEISSTSSCYAARLRTTYHLRGFTDPSILGVSPAKHDKQLAAVAGWLRRLRYRFRCSWSWRCCDRGPRSLVHTEIYRRTTTTPLTMACPTSLPPTTTSEWIMLDIATVNITRKFFLTFLFNAVTHTHTHTQ